MKRTNFKMLLAFGLVIGITGGLYAQAFTPVRNRVYRFMVESWEEGTSRIDRWPELQPDVSKVEITFRSDVTSMVMYAKDGSNIRYEVKPDGKSLIQASDGSFLTTELQGSVTRNGTRVVMQFLNLKEGGIIAIWGNIL